MLIQIQQINFTRNLAQQAIMFFITEEAKDTALFFSTRNCKSILILFFFNIK